MLPILARRHPQRSDKSTSHLLFVGKTAINSNRRYSIRCFFKPPTCRIDPNSLDRFRRSATTGLRVKPCKIPGAHMRPLGERLNSEVALQMLSDPLFEFAEPVGVRLRLRSEQGTVLRLAARALQINNQHPSDVDRDLPPEILLDQCERQIDAGSDASRAPHPTVAHEYRIRFHL